MAKYNGWVNVLVSLVLLLLNGVGVMRESGWARFGDMCFVALFSAILGCSILLAYIQRDLERELSR